MDGIVIEEHGSGKTLACLKSGRTVAVPDSLFASLPAS